MTNSNKPFSHGRVAYTAMIALVYNCIVDCTFVLQWYLETLQSFVPLVTLSFVRETLMRMERQYMPGALHSSYEIDDEKKQTLW